LLSWANTVLAVMTSDAASHIVGTDRPVARFSRLGMGAKRI
jgi:hypothetical protein